MTDREKVIKGLECCCKSYDIVDCREMDCPYREEHYRDGCEVHLMLDALLILQPCVLTLAEADEADVCWLEVRHFERIIPCRVHVGDETVRIRKLIAGSEDVWAADYGKTWRCWTSKPTGAEREATPWQGQ